MRRSINFRRLAEVLLQRGRTTAQLGREIGLSQPAVSRLSTGKTGAISADAGVRLIWLAGGKVELPAELAEAVVTDVATGAASE